MTDSGEIVEQTWKNLFLLLDKTSDSIYCTGLIKPIQQGPIRLKLRSFRVECRGVEHEDTIGSYVDVPSSQYDRFLNHQFGLRLIRLYDSFGGRGVFYRVGAENGSLLLADSYREVTRDFANKFIDPSLEQRLIGFKFG